MKKPKKSRKGLKVFGIIVMVIAVSYLSINLIPRPKYSGVNPWIVQEGERPMVIAHRGGKDLYPEGTILAFERISIDYDIDVLEIDLALTKDDILICSHDLTIDRTSNGTGNVRDYNYTELLDFNFADSFSLPNGTNPYDDHPDAKPEKLENLFINQSDMLYLLEIKNRDEDGDTAAGILVQLVENYNMENNVIVASFSDDVNAAFREQSNDAIMTSTARGETTKFVLMQKFKVGLFYRPEHAALHVPMDEDIGPITIRMDRRHFIKEAHRHNMAVNFWTINEEEDMRRLIELGADGIITDRPDILLDLLADMGY
ncbi:MAG: glycerophosphodiester phosphodiesterase [Promethearchaeota archaeon]